jgi:lysophospholipase L1-like esterase
VDLVVTMLGTNDVKMRFAVTPLEIGEGCRQLLRVIAASEAGPEGAAPRALLVCPPPVVETGWLADMFAGGAQKSRALPAFLAEVARQEGAAFFDAGSVIAVDHVDGVHFSAESHGTLGRAIAEAVREALPAS